MDLKLNFENRDLMRSPQGWPVPIEGADEAAQRLMLRLMVRRGSFRLDPELGSRLYAMPRGDSDRMERFARDAVEEALADLPEARLEGLSCRYDAAEDRAFVDCRFLWRGQNIDLTVESAG